MPWKMREDLRTLLSKIPHREFFVSLFGDRVWLVGGGVRDLLLGKPLKEIDLLVVKHTLEEIIEKLRPYGKVSLVGKSFAVLKFHYQGEIIEISIPRKERRASKSTSIPRDGISELSKQEKSWKQGRKP